MMSHVDHSSEPVLERLASERRAEARRSRSDDPFSSARRTLSDRVTLENEAVNTRSERSRV